MSSGPKIVESSDSYVSFPINGFPVCLVGVTIHALHIMRYISCVKHSALHILRYTSRVAHPASLREYHLGRINSGRFRLSIYNFSTATRISYEV